MSEEERPVSEGSEWVDVSADEDAESESILSDLPEDVEVLKSEVLKSRRKTRELERNAKELETRLQRANDKSEHYRVLLQTQTSETVELQERLKKLQCPNSIEAPSHGASDASAAIMEAKQREELWRMQAHNKITFTSFDAGDLVLFLPTSTGDYIAFNKGCPFRYLSSESVSAAKAKSGDKVEYILGHIIEVDECHAMGVEGGNPYGLPIGTTYFVCTVTVL
mmetsp:Transcript_15084/g.23477  ORF Transcript_15084/g.23477 Transcript_15084/m.23477 type:complete len:223 (-) Transcript_15084:25-693(-)